MDAIRKKMQSMKVIIGELDLGFTIRIVSLLCMYFIIGKNKEVKNLSG